MIGSTLLPRFPLGCMLALAGVAGCALGSGVVGKSNTDATAELHARSGFFESYAGLKPVGKRATLFAHVGRNANLADYDKILLGRLHIWRQAGEEELALSELESLAHRIHRALSATLAVRYTLVEEPEPNSMRLSFGLTHAAESTPGLQCYHTDNAESLIDPIVPELSPQMRDFLGNAVVEVELTDARTGEVLATLLDSRIVENEDEEPVRSWPEVDSVLGRAARRLEAALRNLQSRQTEPGNRGRPRAHSNPCNPIDPGCARDMQHLEVSNRTDSNGARTVE